MAKKFNLKDIFAISLITMSLIFAVIFVFFPTTIGGHIIKILVAIGAFSSIVLWMWMLFDWIFKTFVKKRYKVYWFLVFLFTGPIGSTIYYLTVCKLRLGIKSADVSTQ